MRLPEIAAELRELANKHNSARLSQLADEIARRPSKRGPNVSATVDDAMRARIRQLKATDPTLTHQQIASALNINPGRVSETLRGKRQ